MLYLALLVCVCLIWLGSAMKKKGRWDTEGAAYILCMVIGWLGGFLLIITQVVCMATYATYPDDLRANYQWLVQRHEVDSIMVASGRVDLIEQFQERTLNQGASMFWDRAQGYNQSLRFWRRHPNHSFLWGGWPDPAPAIANYPFYTIVGDFPTEGPGK